MFYIIIDEKINNIRTPLNLKRSISTSAIEEYENDITEEKNTTHEINPYAWTVENCTGTAAEL